MAETTVTVADLVAWIERFYEVIAEHADELTQLDSAIGDADHGTNMRRGCRAAVEALEAAGPEDVSGFGRAIAMKLISAVGGTSGPLYGSFFLALGTAGGSTGELDGAGTVAALRAAVEAVQKRGKAEPGDKTMIDALLPAVEAMEASLGEGGSLADALAAGTKAAEEGMRATIPMLARKGRASYLGERSIGHQDPGATSSWLLVRSAAETLATA
ncbi:MAG: dihydroxyacetone kinase subunit DhaL [Nitriliruptoraceae bacterium]